MRLLNETLNVQLKNISPSIRRPLALAALVGVGTTWLVGEPLARGIVGEFWQDVTSAPTYSALVATCIVYALTLRAARVLRFYDRFLALIVMGGIIIVGLFIRWRFALPAPSSLDWAWRVMVYHFYVASVPIFIWQMIEDWRERRDARAFRTGGNAP